MAAHSPVGVRTVPCFCGIFLDNVYATVRIAPAIVDSLAVGELLDFEADKTIYKWNFNFQYKEICYDNEEIST